MIIIQDLFNNTVIRIREPDVGPFVFWIFYPEGCGFTIRNNIFVVTTNIQVFGPVRSAVGNYRLTKSSAAIGKAIQTLFTFDLDGYSTGRNQGLDIGVYDY